jgi:hypothetical protein
MTSTKDKQSVNNRNERKVNYSKPHMIVPIEDMGWALSQGPAVHKLWSECWMCDPYGSRWMNLKTELKRSAFMAAKKILEERTLFLFKPEKSIRDGRETVSWQTKNLHGSRAKDYWKMKSMTVDSKSMTVDSKSMTVDLESMTVDSISSQTLTQQAFHAPSQTPHKHLSNSSKELLRCEGCEESSSRLPLEAEKSLLTPEEAIRHVERAKQGIIPETEIIELLREYPGQWAEFIHYAQVNKWDLSKHIPKVSNAASEIIEQIKAKKRKQRFQID